MKHSTIREMSFTCISIPNHISIFVIGIFRTIFFSFKLRENHISRPAILSGLIQCKSYWQIILHKLNAISGFIHDVITLVLPWWCTEGEESTETNVSITNQSWNDRYLQMLINWWSNNFGFNTVIICAIILITKQLQSHHLSMYRFCVVKPLR